MKRPGPVTDPAVIHYRDVGDSLDRDAKLAQVDAATLDDDAWRTVTPNAYADWIRQRNPAYMSLRPTAIIQSEPPVPDAPPPLFGLSSFGLIARRDAWVLNSSRLKLHALVERQAEFYNEQVEALQRGAATPTRNLQRFKWDNVSERLARRGVRAKVRDQGFRSGIYRPFFRQHLYFDRVLNSTLSQLPRIFPEPGTRNPSIVVERGLPAPGRSPAVLAVDAVPTDKTGAGASGLACQVLPRYVYTEPLQNATQGELAPPERGRRDNINPEALAAYRARLGADVTADQVFAYVYGVLHSPEYRERWTADLARLLPRIPDPTDRATFKGFAEAGQRLLDLHIGYEDAEPYSLSEYAHDLLVPEGPERYQVTRMRWAEDDRSALRVNDFITLVGIPPEAHEYVVGPRSALDWLIDRYQVKTDKASGIVNDVNDWGLEHGDPRYIVDLVKRITTVSLETMTIVGGLPELREAE